jgi:carboxypeptidase Taq
MIIMSSPLSAYEQLKKRFARIIDLENAQGILSKDMEVFMPEDAAPDRIRQLTALAEVSLEIISSPETARLLDAVEKDKDQLPAVDQRNLQLMRQAWVHQASLPADLVLAVAELGSEGQHRHTQHRKSGDWNTMKDWYQHAFDVMRQVALIKQQQLGSETPYEALLDLFSPSLKDAAVKR